MWSCSASDLEREGVLAGPGVRQLNGQAVLVARPFQLAGVTEQRDRSDVAGRGLLRAQRLDGELLLRPAERDGVERVALGPATASVGPSPKTAQGRVP